MATRIDARGTLGRPRSVCGNPPLLAHSEIARSSARSERQHHLNAETLRLQSAAAACLLLLVLAACGAGAQECSAGGSGRLVDLTVATATGLPVWDSADGLADDWRSMKLSMARGDSMSVSVYNLDAHTGTHIDSPSHMVLDQQPTVEGIGLDVLVGDALVVDVPPGSNITAEVLESMQLPPGVERLLLRTENTHKRLMHTRAFDSSFVAFTRCGAAWLGRHTRVRLVGVDYLSVAVYEDPVATHRELFHKGIIPVEGLDLSVVPAGWLHLICLPAKFHGADGAPVRCIAHLSG